ncbi:MAG TPA: tRNA pseudouridine(38-40) synthase TruA [Chthonomonadaceae bacterium]|nr:tRNA pseudouridine(38-40) synthase TruA [Chthonomonadaceae bacterium]
MRFFKATVEYDGTDFVGFQWQDNGRSVQAALEAAIAKRTGETVRITGAGRTDSGVHALGQVVSFGVETRIPAERMALALNSALPADVSVRKVEEVAEGFSARFSASSRLYAYLILNRSAPSALLRRYSAFCPDRLDIVAMQAGADLLLGEQDFAAFANECEPGQRTYREVLRCRVHRTRDLALVRIEANAFLRGMVRTIVGTLLEIGAGKRAPEDIRAILASRDRRQAGPTAPPQGLCLVRVRYGERKTYARPAPLSHDESVENGDAEGLPESSQRG